MNEELYKENKPKKKSSIVVKIVLFSLLGIFILAMFYNGWTEYNTKKLEEETFDAAYDGIKKKVLNEDYQNRLREFTFSDIEVSTERTYIWDDYVTLKINYNSEELGELIRNGEYEEASAKMYTLLNENNKIIEKCKEVGKKILHKEAERIGYKYVGVSNYFEQPNSSGRQVVAIPGKNSEEFIYFSVEYIEEGMTETRTSLCLNWRNLLYGHPYTQTVEKNGKETECVAIMPWDEYIQTDTYKERHPELNPPKSNFVYTPPQSAKSEKPEIYDPYDALGYGSAHSFYEDNKDSFSSYEDAEIYYWQVYDDLEEYYNGDLIEYEDTGY